MPDIITVHPQKQLEAKLTDLPPDMHLCALALSMYAVRNQSVTLDLCCQAQLQSPEVAGIAQLFTVEKHPEHLQLTPGEHLQWPTIQLDSLTQPYSEAIVMIFLGAGHVVHIEQLREDTFQSMQQKVAALGLHLQAENNLVRLETPLQAKIPSTIDEPDLVTLLLGYAFGSATNISTRINRPYASALRALFSTMKLGLEITMDRSEQPQVQSELARRLLRMQQRSQSKKKNAPAQEQFYQLNAAFEDSQHTALPPRITLPADMQLANLLIASKAAVSRGTLLLEAVSLEPWALPLQSALHRMGYSAAMQPKGSCSFGQTGQIQISRAQLHGRKTSLIPYYRWGCHLEALLLCACFAEGESIIRDLNRPRFGSDYFHGLCEKLKELDFNLGEMPDGCVLRGKEGIDGFDAVETISAPQEFLFFILALRAQGSSQIAITHLHKRWPAITEFLSSLAPIQS